MIVAVTTFFAAITPFLPDLRIVLANLINLWFFLSGVFWDVGSFSAEAQFYLRGNPMTVILESYRQIVLYDSWPDFSRLASVGLVAAGGCVVSAWIVHRYDHVYPKLSR